ncbi:uncharacterized protein BDZ99DRAFT_524378 [Mytilinidion resinicola]|uniref:Uncharacterized protein n=1 Tax=Mytilinidion resinicola TaxID=574789 RepID=A0A6A6YA47_9PEZI|nr:uncharacterized protein BDZ99DRAFT_524378 [Mytilinidion resinicola]KAF2805403.1 hypothetical protein BDZ99DRAFT_524378 [Mytilinidion resinicola]
MKDTPDMRVLLRASSVILAWFLMICQKTMNVDVRFAFVDGGFVHTFLHDVAPLGVRRYGVPLALDLDWRLKLAVIYGWRCDFSVCGMAAALFSLLGGYVRHIEEIHVVPNARWTPRQWSQYGMRDGSTYTHTLFRIELHNGQKWALDLSGFQHGWRHALTPWEQFCTTRMKGEHFQLANLGDELAKWTALAAISEPHAFGVEVDRIVREAIQTCFGTDNDIARNRVFEMAHEDDFQELFKSSVGTFEEMLDRNLHRWF